MIDVTNETRWGTLCQALVGHGYKIWQQESDVVPDYWIAIDHEPKTYKRFVKLVARRRRILLTVEPKVVQPLQYRRSSMALRYGKIVNVGMDHSALQDHKLPTTWLGGQRGLRELANNFCWDSSYRSNPRQQSVSVLNNNKFSLVQGSNYHLRVAAINRLTENGLRVELGGSNWNKSLFWVSYQNIKAILYALRCLQRIHLSRWVPMLRLNDRLKVLGQVPDGMGFLRLNEVSLVIENDPTYVSKKIFNALIAGARCVYVGPDISTWGIPESICIQAEANSGDILRAVVRMLSTSIDESVDTWPRAQEVFRDWDMMSRSNELIPHLFR